ncbi:hypothetical protein [Streptomyces sp. NPDC004682]
MDEDENASDLFGDLVEGLEDEFNTKLLKKRGAFAMASARLTGGVYTEAVASGVPAALAQDMAEDSWTILMGIPRVVEVVSDDSDGDEG